MNRTIWRANSWAIFFLLIYVVLALKIITFRELDHNIFFGIYSVLVSFYLLSRFALSFFYEPPTVKFDRGYEPTVTFGVPAKNEGENIRETILRIARSDYPKNKFDIVAVNDGSTDSTLAEMLEAQKIARSEGVSVRVMDWKENKGKREGMAECVKQSSNEIVIFIDSDSFVEEKTTREFVKYFSDPSIAAVAGHAYVANAEKNMLTKMQAVRYYISFTVNKAAEALFGSVTCCSGCCSAYRRSYVVKIINAWLHQRFLGVRCTYGDDRSLTNFLLFRGYNCIFGPDAIAYTFVPENFRQFLRQQLRWKKSWFRESILACTFMWRRNPIMSASFYLGVFLPLLAPIVFIRAVLWMPFFQGRSPTFYVIGFILMAVLSGVYYYARTGDKKWAYGVLFSTLYALVLIWQLPYAIVNIRDSRWGTR
ncbi:glycosyltransferase [Candidatus Giovannonibacteria bacterium]|nr:glycosyltransferase [Candidatus Giovannonibacteria bacterium]